MGRAALDAALELGIPSQDRLDFTSVGFGSTGDQTERSIPLFQSEVICFSGKTWVTVPVKSSAVSIIISERVG